MRIFISNGKTLTIKYIRKKSNSVSYIQLKQKKKYLDEKYKDYLNNKSNSR
ncbi:MAG: hypothetical protein JETCAE03_35270 [Ignavibacteriaceae bacterium]|nr:MAG: hypothetical protein JETCAE03_35270 [Ignavibacteriaceae bacterium]